MDDRTLLKLAAKALAEHAAWVARNAAREAMKQWRRDVGLDRGQDFGPGDYDEEDVPAIRKLIEDAASTQRKLGTARAATRRAIVRAAAAIGGRMP